MRFSSIRCSCVAAFIAGEKNWKLPRPSRLAAYIAMSAWRSRVSASSAVVREQGHAHAGAAVRGDAVQVVRLLQRLDQAHRHRASRCPGVERAAQHDDEFVAAQARQGVDVAQQVLHARGWRPPAAGRRPGGRASR